MDFRRRLPTIVWGLLPFIITGAFVLIKPPAPIWSPDSVTYVQMMLADAHADPKLAFAYGPNFAHLDTAEHRYALEHIFKNRPLYPWLGSLLYPYRGVQGLVDISRLSYIVTTMLLFTLAARFAGGPIASVCATAFAVWPATRELANWILTDMLALCLWTAVILVLIMAVERQTWLNLIALAVLSAALSTARPMIYYPVIAAFVIAIARRDAASYRVAAVSVFVAAGYAVTAWAAGFPTMIEHEQFARHHDQELGRDPGPSLLAWLLVNFITVAKSEIKRTILSVYPAAILLASALGVWLSRQTTLVALFLAALAASLISLFFNPFEYDFYRTIVTPLIPVFVVGTALLFRRLIPTQNLGLARPSLR